MRSPRRILDRAMRRLLPDGPLVDAPPSMVADTETNIRFQIEANYGQGLAHAYDEFRRLLERCRTDPSIRTEPLTALGTPTPADARRVFLRIDVDADPWTGVRMSRDLAFFGLAGNIFLLHTAPYYGYWAGDTFVRHGWMPTIVRDLVVAGVEIGLHNDAMGLARTLSNPGLAATAMTAEIKWLRSQGANVRGTVGHNSIPGQGAENSEVFVGRRLMPNRLDPRRSRLPIESVREYALSLVYEGTGAVPRPAAALDAAEIAGYVDASRNASTRDEDWMRLYLVDNPLHDWAADFQIWAIGGGRWVLGGRTPEGDRRFEWNIDVARVLDALGEIPAGSSTMIVLHPEYFHP